MKQVLLILMFILLICLCLFFWLKLENIRLKFRRQGIIGPLPSLITGNIPEIKQIMSVVPNSDPANKDPKDISPFYCSFNLFPYFKQWTKQYGGTFMFTLGRQHFLYVNNLKLVKEISIFKSWDLGKPAYLQKDRGPLLGKGLISTNGAVWSHQRKTIGPQLYVEKVKDTVDIIVESACTLIKSWDNVVKAEDGVAELIVDEYVRNFTSEIISKMMFGNNFFEGMKLFPKFKTLINVMSTPTLLSGVPFSRFLPTKKNKVVWGLEKEIYAIIMDIVKKQKATTSENMLQTLMEGSMNGELGPSTADQFIVDNCKDVYLGAFEINAVVAIWGLMLLASHPEWQARVRSEVQEVWGDKPPDANMLGKMKVLRMVIQEILRLYPGVAFVSRQALQDLKLGDTCVPKGVNIWIWMLALHRDPELWGPDADKFNPERFANGVSAACKSSQAYIPFGVGARVCPGQNLAITELKVLFAMVVSKFSLDISPNYRHSPRYGLLVEPEHGVNLLVKNI